MDISYRSLDRARQGIYGQNSFRGVDKDILQHYFRPYAQGYELQEMIKSKVQFSYGNLLQFKAFQEYDIIFCRNLLIYLDRDTRTQAIANLARALTPDGLLFVGHSEAGCLMNTVFVSAGPAKAFVFRRHQPTPAPMPVVPQPSPSVKVVAPPPECLLAQAQLKANQNDLVSALSLCQAYLQAHPLDSSAHTLLGEIYQAQGEIAQAMQCYQKALYLDPVHYSALVHLMLLKQEQGDRAGAMILQQRIDRLGHREN